MSAPGLAAERTSRRTRRLEFSGDLVLRVGAGLIILAVWEIAARLWAPAYMAKPTRIVAAIPEVAANPAFWQAAGLTLAAIVKGLAIAFVIGAVVGMAIGRMRMAERLLQIYVSGFFAMPMVAILPLFSLWFGYSGDARLATIVFAAVFAIIINVADGARAVPPEHIEVSRAFRSSGWRRVFDVILPSSMPYLLAGLRLAAARALIGAVVAEFFLAIPGLGYFILFETRTFHHNQAFVAVALLAAAGLLFEFVLAWATAKFLPWYRRAERAN